MQNEPDQRSILPPDDPPFRGEINVAITDSTADFPEPLRAPAGAPNVLLIVGDDIGYGHMSAFGGPARTPTFDRLAAQGLKYTNFHTTAVCSASRACLLTGRNAHSVGMGAQDLEHGRSAARDQGVVAREPGRGLGDRARTVTAPRGSARPTSPRCTRSRSPDRSIAGPAEWAPSTSTASSVRA